MQPNNARGAEAPPGKQEFFLIQCLRGLAALMVVAHHGFYEATQRLGNKGEWLNGASGVDIFFIISGFVMAVSSRRLLGTAAPALTFLKRRLERVVPLYWLFTTAKVLLLLLAPAVAAHALGSHWNILASYLFLPSKDADGAIYPVLVVGWTLNFEMLFYALFASALALRVRPLFLLTPALLLLSLTPVFLPHPPTALAFWGSSLILEFGFGMLLAEATPFLLTLGSHPTPCSCPSCCHSRRESASALASPLSTPQNSVISTEAHHSLTVMGAAERPPYSPLLLGLLAAAIALALLFSFAPWAISSPWRFLAWGLPALLLAAAAIQLEPAVGTRVPRWLLRLGDASYSIYLAHTFVLSALASVLHRLPVPALRSVPAVVLLSLVTGTGSGLLVYRFVERPVIHLFARRRRLAPIAVPA